MSFDGFVLAGGRSERMGVDKARLPVPGRWPMAVHVASVLAEVCGRVALVRRGPPDGLPWIRPDGTPLEVVCEADVGAPHPLYGVATACAAARTPLLLVVTTDVPSLTAGALRALIDGYEPGAMVVASDGDRVHPLVALVPRSAGPEAEQAARDGTSATAFFRDALRVVLPTEVLRNVNRWEDAGVADPLAALSARLPEVSDRALDGERTRLLQRGVLMPPPGFFLVREGDAAG